jgi:UDP-N-acetylmuramate--alanine ligase
MHALRLAGQHEAVFVENIADMPQVVLQLAKDGDVILTMGAGSVGNVPGAVKQMAQT